MTSNKDTANLKKKSGFFARWRRSEPEEEVNEVEPDAPQATGSDDNNLVPEDDDRLGAEVESQSVPQQADAQIAPSQSLSLPSSENFVGEDQHANEQVRSGPAIDIGAVVDDRTETGTLCAELPAAPDPEQNSDAAITPMAPKPSRPPGLFSRALSKTGRGLETVLLGRRQIDEQLFDDLETQLLVADVGVDVCTDIIDELTDRVKRRQLGNSDALRAELHQVMVDILRPCEQALDVARQQPFVVLVVGVNGVGKTTTIGKLARNFQKQGLSVMLAAGDTFRAAAVEQLQAWGQRNDVPVVAQHTGADSASVIYDAIESAIARNVDVLIADTAGRLHTKSNLMEELVKIKRVMAKLDSSAPHEVLLVLDAGTGQNALRQVQEFDGAVGVTGLAVTKLDGTAKGGVVFALCKRFGIPIRYVGLGEGLDDLRAFAAADYVRAMLSEDKNDTF